jgi:PilZ domain
MVFQPMTVVNIANAGAQVETPFPLQLDSLHQFRLSLGDVSVIVQGRIAHCRLEELRRATPVYFSGVEFVEPSEHVTRAIAAFVEAHDSSPAPDGVLDGEILGDGGWGG